MIGLLSVIVVCFLLPIGVTIYAARQSKWAIIYFLAGVLSFFASQVCIRLPLLEHVLAKQDWFMVLSMRAWFMILFYAGTAGLFEGVGRQVGLYLSAKGRRLSWLDGVVFGLGHGGFEAMFLVGVNAVFQYFQYGNQISMNLLVAAFERLCAISIHVFMSLLIADGIMKKSKWYLAAAILLHAFADGLMMAVQMWTGSLFFTLLAVAIVSLLYFIAAVRYRKSFIYP